MEGCSRHAVFHFPLNNDKFGLRAFPEAFPAYSAFSVSSTAMWKNTAPDTIEKSKREWTKDTSVVITWKNSLSLKVPSCVCGVVRQSPCFDRHPRARGCHASHQLDAFMYGIISFHRSMSIKSTTDGVVAQFQNRAATPRREQVSRRNVYSDGRKADGGYNHAENKLVRIAYTAIKR